MGTGIDFHDVVEIKMLKHIKWVDGNMGDYYSKSMEATDSNGNTMEITFYSEHEGWKHEGDIYNLVFDSETEIEEIGVKK